MARPPVLQSLRSSLSSSQKRWHSLHRLVVVILEPDLVHPLRDDAQQEGDVAHRDTGGTTQRNVTAGSGADLGLQRLSAGAGRARRESDDVVRLAERRETAEARARIN